MRENRQRIIANPNKKSGGEDILWALKLYSLTLVIPLALSAINILFVGILGIGDVVNLKYNFLELFEIIWVDYFATGTLLGIIAWRWHLMLLVLAYIIIKLGNLKT